MAHIEMDGAVGDIRHNSRRGSPEVDLRSGYITTTIGIPPGGSSAHGPSLQLESGDYLLLENGDRLLLG